MYKISVPVPNRNVKRCGRDQILQELKQLDASRVFLSLSTYELDPDKRANIMAELKDNCRYFKENGLEVGAWIWTFWVKGNTQFRNMRAITGTEITEFMCPSDDGFVQFASDYIQDVAKCGVDLIMFDDDFRYGFLVDSPGCLCDGHIARINQLTGVNSTREELEIHITSGGKNKFRDAYLQANGEAFRKFAHAVRAAVDAVSPDIRMGTCACMSSWDIDGIHARELANILAGSTKPFVRLIGAPYWAAKKAWGNALQDVVELERMESAWTRTADLEIMAEGDSYPRPRIHCPASFLEGFDTAIRVSGCTDGILKYGIDYHSNAGYEPGYVTFHRRNRPLYEAIDRLFTDKVSRGVRVYEFPEKVSDLVMPTKVNQQVNIQNLFFSKAARTLSGCTIPTVYEGADLCGIAFDENARHLPPEALDKGLILDIAAAEILAEQGVDVGIAHIGSEITSGECERFVYNNNHILALGSAVYDIQLRENAEVLSEMITPLGKIPVSYRYENAAGNRFLVLNINTRSESNNLLMHYERSRQYAETIPWLCGESLPAYVYGHPSLYIQCKEDDTALSVGLWNFFADIATEPVIELSRAYSEIQFVNCGGQMKGNQVFLTDIPAYGFAAFSVTK